MYRKLKQKKMMPTRCSYPNMWTSNVLMPYNAVKQLDVLEEDVDLN